MMLETGDELARACAAAMLSRDAAAQSLGIAIVDAREGYAQIEMTITAAMINGHATAHGGVVFTFADSAFAYACNSRNVPHVALNAAINFTAPARLGQRLVAEAREIVLKGRTGVYDVVVSDAATGELTATFRGTCYRIRGNVLSE
jgi:acyl-CoA thioesterase